VSRTQEIANLGRQEHEHAGSGMRVEEGSTGTASMRSDHGLPVEASERAANERNEQDVATLSIVAKKGEHYGLAYTPDFTDDREQPQPETL